jgi:hypothetical protein
MLPSLTFLSQNDEYRFVSFICQMTTVSLSYWRMYSSFWQTWSTFSVALPVMPVINCRGNSFSGYLSWGQRSPKLWPSMGKPSHFHWLLPLHSGWYQHNDANQFYCACTSMTGLGSCICPLGGDSSGFGHHFHCQILAAPSSASCGPHQSRPQMFASFVFV